MSKKNKPAWKGSRRIDKKEIEFTLACDCGLRRIYRYLPFPTERLRADWKSGPEMLEDILVNRRLRASNPRNFNDPWDCKPCIHPDQLSDPATRRAMADVLMASDNGGNTFEISDYPRLTDPEFLKHCIPRFNDAMANFIQKRWGIICLSADPCSTTMWSHYSDNHKGICLEFTVEDTIFGLATKMIYLASYPNMLRGGKFELYMLTVKSKDWEKEQEYRLICPLSGNVTDAKKSPLIMKDGFLPFDIAGLHSVIMGCQLGDDERREIGRLVRLHAPHVRLKRAARVPHNYRLTLENYTQS